MATRRKYPSKSKKSTIFSSKSVKWIVGLFLLLCTIIFAYQKKDAVLYYFGFKFKNLVYITDANAIPEKEMAKLKNLDYLILNCIRKEEPHPAHFILPQVLELFEILKPKKMFLTHISHHMGIHHHVEDELPADVHLAYDRMEIDF